jgi:phosphatidylglycerophosphate synthase
MMPMTRAAEAPLTEGIRLRGSAWRALGLALQVVAVGAWLLERAFGLGDWYPAAAVGLALLGAWAVMAYLPGLHPHPRFGAANVVTLARGVIAALLGALVVAPTSPGVAAFATAAGTLAALLDTVDGRLARGSGVASEFGARFDMETDALLVLALALLAWRWDRAGAWVLLSGLLRYGFVAAGLLVPWLRRPLPASRRRQTVCVVQIVLLLAVISPLLPPGASWPLALAGLLLLASSFAIDLTWLASYRRLSRATVGPPDSQPPPKPARTRPDFT